MTAPHFIFSGRSFPLLYCLEHSRTFFLFPRKEMLLWCCHAAFVAQGVTVVYASMADLGVREYEQVISGKIAVSLGYMIVDFHGVSWLFYPYRYDRFAYSLWLSAACDNIQEFILFPIDSVVGSYACNYCWCFLYLAAGFSWTRFIFGGKQYVPRSLQTVWAFSARQVVYFCGGPAVGNLARAVYGQLCEAEQDRKMD